LHLDELDEFASQLFPITTSQDTPLWAKRRVNRWEKSAKGWHQDRKLTFAEYDESGRSSGPPEQVKKKAGLRIRPETCGERVRDFERS
jgi:hypothetical protein